MKVSKYISIAEATKSQTAERLGIDNTPGYEELEAMRFVATEYFDPVREHVGGPLAVSSFFRCEALNKAIGGSATSDHVFGRAIDIDADMYGNGTNKQVFDFIRAKGGFDQLIWEFGTKSNPAWVHVGKRKSGNRGQVLRAYKENGKTKYVPFDLY